MIAGLRAFGVASSLCIVAGVLLVTAKPPLDSYVTEYLDQCLIKNNCPAFDPAPGTSLLPIIPRQLKSADESVGVAVLDTDDIQLIDVEAYLAPRKARSDASKRSR